jgi:hypothetical protein
MGSWGVGMSANDDAADAISDRPRSKSAAEYLRSLLAMPADNGRRAKMILGYAEYMLLSPKLSKGFDFKIAVNKVISAELKENRLGLWREPEERKAALLRFRKVLLHGLKSLTEDEMMSSAKDNEGLLSRILS